MPTSTIWRRQSSNPVSRDARSVRPSCERLSPEPFKPSPTLIHVSARSYQTGHQPHGLGLSGTSLSNENFDFTHPNSLTIDRNGAAHVGARGRTASYQGRNSTKGARYSDTRQISNPSRSSKIKNHTRSGSTIDDLANAAIATSPTFAASSPTYAFGSPTNTNVTRPATSYINGYKHDDSSFDRPSKRIKSEKLHPAEWSPQHERPRTSHAYEYQFPRQEDAELLLSLSYGPKWSLQQSPFAPPPLTFEQPSNAPLDRDAVVGEKIAEDFQSSASGLQMEFDSNATSKVAAEVVSSAQKDIAQLAADTDMTDASILSETSTFIPEPAPEPVNIPEESEPEPEKPPIAAPALIDAPKQDLTPAEQLQQGTLGMPAEIEVTAISAPTPAPAPKKQRKIQPEVQAEVCAFCKMLQRAGGDDDNTTQWIGCEHCKSWYHAMCAGFKDKQEARSVDKFFCQQCESQYGKTTFVRKSSRARTAIDYAGLNQGVVKPSDTSTMHHYIQPIKDGRIKVLPDDFARVRPELLTADFWENMDGMKRPFVVPRCWNPRFGAFDSQGDASDKIDAGPLHDDAHIHYDLHGAVMAKSTETTGSADRIDDDATNYETVIDCDQDFLDMVMPRDLTVRKVAELFGPHEPVPVIDVKSQETKGAFTLSDWAEYYELDGEKPIRNVISLEVSKSRLGRLIRRPRVVRDIDLEDHVWDHESRGTSNKRPVQFYCLMSVADSYTDFHIDFGGSSVYYHILKGVKTFFFIPPEDKYLKKYEEWCNSDVQNDTWLGDLCGGNVTRVDLHEGDTAFIPAGWIHSVWTPEDSLVIGGNFLTSLDYELQLKVANIEKTTNVPLKFRYPFFQKVMWFTLLKYLDDDPLPDEVLRDFDEDPDYRFLRANPIWHEVEDLANTAEPGDAEYNARTYPKSELKGLPALRDYLYRTARIHADLPVPDINKRQIDAVKSSIPKGYGDPMQLAKTFAVWSAWKIGNEPAPDWVHADAGLASDLKEREKLKKAEIFRVPPERVSARKASQAPVSQIEDSVGTPRKASQEAETIDAVKPPSSGSKSSSLKVACEPCRKRRIKCRHKDGDVSPSSASPAAIRPRTYSNVSVDIPKLASASPVLNGFEAIPTTNGNTSEFSHTSDLAQAALASLHSQSSDPIQPSSTPTNGNSSRKGRSKACEECRKSKRRCVHDEYGRVDPAKAAEPAKPRGSATKRVSRSGDEVMVNKVKLEGDIDPSFMDPVFAELSQSVDIDANIDPALMNDVSMHGYDHGMADQVFQATDLHIPFDAPMQEDLEIDGERMEDMHFEEMQFTSVDLKNTADGLIDPHLELTQIVHSNFPEPLLAAQVSNLRRSPEHDISYSPITVDGQPIESTEKSDVDMTDVPIITPVSRQSSRQPKVVDRYVPEAFRSPSKSVPRLVKNEHRDSSSGESGHMIDTADEKRRSSSNTSGTIHQAVASVLKRRASRELSGRPTSRDSTVESERDADDERMARELQAAENGLRRRPSVRI